jgi:hypothetical protein
MKKLLVVIIILAVAILMTQTLPDKKAHKRAMMKAVSEYVDEKAEENGFHSNVITNLGKSVVNFAAATAIDAKLKVNNYYLFNTTSVRLKGEDKLLSIGLFGHVFTFDKEMLREALEEGEEQVE